MYYPILGKLISEKEICDIDLSHQNDDLEYKRTSDPKYLDEFITRTLDANNVQYGIGGYAEKRAIYEASENFGSDSETRCIHLGIDIWTKVYTTFFAPLNGIVHSFKNNDLKYDYGGTIILQHQEEDEIFHTLYGHLSLSSLVGLKKGMKIKAGTPLCQIGDWHENGGWPPHLHFQMIRDMQGMEGDYFGACSEKEKEFYLDNCLDPFYLIEATIAK